MTAAIKRFAARSTPGTDLASPATGPVATAGSLTFIAERNIVPRSAGRQVATGTGLVSLGIGHLPTKASATSTANVMRTRQTGTHPWLRRGPHDDGSTAGIPFHATPIDESRLRAQACLAAKCRPGTLRPSVWPSPAP